MNPPTPSTYAGLSSAQWAEVGAHITRAAEHVLRAAMLDAVQDAEDLRRHLSALYVLLDLTSHTAEQYSTYAAHADHKHN